jgi:hypothetical protein
MIKTSLLSYILLSLAILTSLEMPFFSDFIGYFSIIFTLFVIRDIILLFGVSLDSKSRSIDWKKLLQARKENVLSLLDGAVLFNRIILFPFLLITYITYILLKQLEISPWVDTLFTKFPLEYTLLGMVALSGIITLFRESLEAPYEKSKANRKKARLFVLWTIMLSLLAVGIILSETSSLGFLSIPISIISGLLIFLIGTLLLEEDDHTSL